MTLKEAIELLQKHQQWRRGADIDMQNPTQLGIAIDILIEEALKNFVDNVTRIEVIDENGVQIQIQDDGRTLKLFIDNEKH